MHLDDIVAGLLIGTLGLFGAIAFVAALTFVVLIGVEAGYDAYQWLGGDLGD